MNNLLPLLVVLFFCGCTSAATMQSSNVIEHEINEERLLTEGEFYARVSQSSDLIYEGMKAVREAVDLYAKDNGGALPSEGNTDEKKILLEGGYLEEWPLVPTFAFTEPVQKEIRYFDNFADMDDSGAVEDVIIVQNLKTEVCQDFVRRYASPGFGENIYDYEAEGEKYPGQTIGRHVKIFAINWSVSSVRDICDILWVIRYTKFPDE